nr:Photosystem II PsbX [Ipomoea batatas]
MASMSMAMPIAASQKRVQPPGAAAFFNPLPARPSKSVVCSRSGKRLQISASLKEKAITGLTAAALTASMLVPEAAEAAVSPSLKNFLLSIVAGGVVVAVIVGAVIGVSNFDPVKRS